MSDEKRATLPIIKITTSHRGIAKVAEEAGELLCEIGKLIAYPDQIHPDGRGHTRERVLREMADLSAAITFYIERNCNPGEIDTFHLRRQLKIDQFYDWDKHEGMTGIRQIEKMGEE